MARACDVCSSLYEPLRRTSRYCSGACRKRAQRNGLAQPVQERRQVPEQQPARALAAGGRLTAAVMRELDEAGRKDSALGQGCIALALRVDAAQTETGSAVAALVRELRAAMKDALAGAADEPDILDELAAARQERLARAARGG